MIKDKNSSKTKNLLNDTATGGEGSTDTTIKSKSNNGVSIEKDQRQIFINLIAKFCDKCGTPYTPDNVRIVKDTEFSSIIHFACFSCKSNHIATFFKPMGMSSRAPINTDLSVDEISEFTRKGKVSSEEILDLYNELTNE